MTAETSPVVNLAGSVATSAAMWGWLRSALLVLLAAPE